MPQRVNFFGVETPFGIRQKTLAESSGSLPVMLGSHLFSVTELRFCLAATVSLLLVRRVTYFMGNLYIAGGI